MSSTPPPPGWGPSAALSAGRGGSEPERTSLLRGKSFLGFLNEAALNQVCGVATTDSNNNKRLDKKFDGICIKEDCKTPSHFNVKRSSNFVPGWYLIRNNGTRVRDVHMHPRGEPSLATLHTQSLLNLRIKDPMLAVTIFERLNNATTTAIGQRETQALSMDSGFRAEVDSNDGAVSDRDDADLSYDEALEPDNDPVVVKIKSPVLKSPQPSDVDARRLLEAKKLIDELPSDPETLSEQEATHLKILLAAAEAADISAEGSFVPPAMVTNLLKVTNTLLGVVVASNERQSQLGFQLDENLSFTDSVSKLVKNRTTKGALVPSVKSQNLWKGVQLLQDNDLHHDRVIKNLTTDVEKAYQKIGEMQDLLKGKNIEVEAMRVGFRQTESLLLSRIVALEKENDTSINKSTASVETDLTYLQGKYEMLQNTVDRIERITSANAQSAVNSDPVAVSGRNDDFFNSLDNLSRQVDDLRKHVIPSSSADNSEGGRPVRVGDTMMSSPGDVAAYLQKHSDLDVNTGFLIGYDILLQRVFDAGTSNYNQLESIKSTHVSSTMGLSSVESYALFCMKLRLPQLFCAKKSGAGGMTKMISHTDWRPTSSRILSGVAHELESKLGEIFNSYGTAIRQHYSSSEPIQVAWLSLSLEYLHTSYTFVQRLLRYIDEQFRFLTYGTDKDDAWEVIMKAVKSIFEDYFAPVRDIPISELPKSDNSLGKLRFCANLVWNSLQTMELTKEMMDKDIRHHHMISSAYTEWSLINSGKTEAKRAMDAVAKMESELKDVSSSVSSLKKLVNDTASTAKGAKGSADKAIARVDKLEKK